MPARPIGQTGMSVLLSNGPDPHGNALTLTLSQRERGQGVLTLSQRERGPFRSLRH